MLGRDTVLSGPYEDDPALMGLPHGKLNRDPSAPGLNQYTPKSKLLKEAWPLSQAIKIEYGDGKVLTKVYPPQAMRLSVGSYMKHSINGSMSDIRSLRSRDAAILGQMSIKASDYLLQESLRESIKESIRESTEKPELPRF